VWSSDRRRPNANSFSPEFADRAANEIMTIYGTAA